MRVWGLVVLLSSGCSFIFAKGPPPDHPTRDDYTCTSSVLLPAADVAWGSLNLLWGTVRALVKPDSFGEDVSKGQVIGVTLGWAVLSGFSARHGFLKVRDCRRAQEGTLARFGAGAQRRYATTPLYTGGAMLGGTYALTLALTGAISQEGYKAQSLYYVVFPIIGPVALLGSGIADSGHTFPLLASSALQTTGAVLLFLGTRSRITVVPTVGPDRVGASLVVLDF